METEDQHPADYRSRLVSATSARFDQYPAGSTIVTQFVIKTSGGRIMSFDAPSGSALALASAVENAALAETHRISIVERIVATPFGDSIQLEPASQVFDFIAACRVVAICSFMAIEYFTNDVISHFPNAPVHVERQAHDKAGTQRQRRRTITLPAKSLERSGTHEKLDRVLPQLLGIESPKGKYAWETFEHLRRLRDETVHTKSRDLNPRVLHSDDLDRPSVIRQYLEEDLNEWISTAVLMMEYFKPRVNVLQLDWLDNFKHD